MSEIQFGETSSGAAVVQGSFVSADQGAARSMGPGFRRPGGGEDREKTLREGKRFMLGFAAEHKISEAVVNSGMQIFKLAVMNNFIQGRRMNMVAAVCLYTACRKEKPCKVMLIDFADSCAVNVFKLGHCFKALHEKVTLSKDGIQPVLPEDLIYRFAMKLEFGNKTTKVAEDAVRLVQRMAKDWMVMGRRPSGVCGACLIIAARMHNFRRLIGEVVYIVKVTSQTIQKRLDEFKITASSELTVEEFLKNEFLESAHDPPSFYEKSETFQAQKNKRKRKRLMLLEGETEDDHGAGSISSGSPTPQPDSTQPNLDADGFVIPPLPPNTASQPEIPIDPSLLEADEDRALDALAAEHTTADDEEDSDEANENALIASEVSEMINDPNTEEHAIAFATAEQRVLLHIQRLDALNPPKEVPMGEDIDDSEFADDPEIRNCVLTEEEAAIKEQIWLNANKDWLLKQQEKEFKRQLAAMGPPKATRKRIKRPRIGEGQTEAASTPEEAAVGVMKNRSWSKRINYDAIKGLFNDDDDGDGRSTVSATSRITSVAPSTVVSPRGGSDAGSVVGSVAGSVAGSRAGSVAGSEIGDYNSVVDDDDVGDSRIEEDFGPDLDDNWEEDYMDD